MSSHKFQTEVNQLLHLIIHSLYSHKEIFLRELISNAADALEKLKYLTLTDDAFKSFPFDPRIDISFDKNSNILTVADTGIGMNETDLVENLGTIASSGTRKFLEQITGDQKKDSGLIGQFGVGFYSSFMVADRIEVITRKAGEDKAYRWASDGKGEYQIEEASRDGAGTTITLHLNENGAEYASRWQIEDIVKKYSNHIMFPIFLHYEDTTYEGEGDKKKEKKENKVSQINQASALWKRSKSELKEEDYHGFYKTLSHDTEAPMLYTHTQAEGAMEYTTLFYVPAKAPFDLYYRDYRAGVKLYVKRVFITDDDRELMPTYLRFVRGIIDSEDLPLNVSREMLQKNRILEKIKSASVKKISEELKKLAEDTERYAAFWKEYSRPMKEGLYMDFENREVLLDLMRFKSTKADGFVSLAEYKDRMQTDQKAIYYITGEREANLRNSPLLEMYRDKDVEVLIMDDEIDEVILPQVGRYKDIELKSVNRSDAAEDLKSEGDKKAEKEVEPLVKRIKQVLGDRVKDVKASTRLSSSPSCIVADEKDPTVQMQGLLKAMGNADISSVKPILEINPAHDIVVRLKDVSDEAVFADISSLLYEQAMLIEGVKLENPGQFVERLNRVVAKAL